MAMTAEYKQTLLGVIPKDWDVLELSKVCSMKSGDSITSAKIDSFSQFPCYGGNGLRGFTTRFTHDGLFALIGRQGALCGNVLGVEGKFFASEHAIVVTAFEHTDIRWLTYMLGEMRLNRLSESSAQPGLSVGKLLRLPLAVPRQKVEQSAIATTLRDVDVLLDSLDRLIAKKRDLKQAAMQQLLTGKTRLPGFRGKWDEPLLGELFTFKNGLNKEKEFFGYGTPIVNYMDVFGNRGVHANDIKGRVSLSSDEVRRFNVRQGDVFFTRTSETAADVGMTSVMLDEPKDTVFSGFVLRARPKDDSLVNEFKKYCFSTNSVRQQITSQSTETTRALTNTRCLSAVTIARPPKLEQIAIAEALADMDAELAALEQRRDKTCLLKQGMMQELLTGRKRLI